MGVYHMAIMTATKNPDSEPKQYVEPWDCVEILQPEPVAAGTIAPPGITLGGSAFGQHSYQGSLYVRVVESLLCKDGDWFQKPLVWAGDDDGNSAYQVRVEGGDDLFLNLYNLCKQTDLGKQVEVQDEQEQPNNNKPQPLGKHYRYILNHDKQIYVDMEACTEGEIHPLPVLTLDEPIQSVEERCSDVGQWAFDRISVQNTVPCDDFKPFSLTFK